MYCVLSPHYCPCQVFVSKPKISISHLCAFKKYIYILLAFVIIMFSTNKRCVTDRPTSGLPSPWLRCPSFPSLETNIRRAASDPSPQCSQRCFQGRAALIATESGEEVKEDQFGTFAGTDTFTNLPSLLTTLLAVNKTIRRMVANKIFQNCA